MAVLETLFRDIQKFPANIGGNVLTEWGVEPCDVSGSCSTVSMRLVVLGRRVEFQLGCIPSHGDKRT